MRPAVAVGEAAFRSAPAPSVANPDASVATGEGRSWRFSGEAASSAESIDCFVMKDSTITDGLLDKFLLDAHDLIAMGGGASLVMELDRAGDSLPETDSSCS